METLLLARHGESVYSAAGLVNGDPSKSVDLTERGREEARRLGAGLAHQPIELCVVTEFPRTRETAELALGGQAIPVLVMPELNDPRPGAFEAQPLAEYRAWFEAKGPVAPTPGGGESRVETVERYARALRALVARPEPTILVVAHGLPVTYVVLAARGADLPLSLEGIQVDHAALHGLTTEEVRAAAHRLEAWAEERRAA